MKSAISRAPITASTGLSDSAQIVRGGQNLTTVGAVPYVSASGVLNQDTKLTWSTTNGTLSVSGVAGKDAPALSVTKGVGSASGIDITVDSSGYATRWFTPSFSSGTNPSAFIGDSGAFSTRASILVSNNTSGSGLSFNILAPTSDPSMIQAWSDVNGPTMQLRSTDVASDGNSRNLDLLDHSGNYRIVFEELGHIRFSATTRAAANVGLQRHPTTIDGNGVLNVTDGSLAGTGQGAIRANTLYLGVSDARILSEMNMRGDFSFRWSSTADDYKATKDTSLSRISAGVIGVGTGAAGSTAGAAAMNTLGVGVTPTNTANVSQIVVKAGSSQSTTNLQEWQNNAGTVLASVGSGGAMSASSGIYLDAGGTWSVASLAMRFRSDSYLAFASGTNASGTLDTSLSRIGAGIVGVGTGSAGSTAGTLQAKSVAIISPVVPATAADAGTAGAISWDSSFIYLCTASGAWKRVAIATW